MQPTFAQAEESSTELVPRSDPRSAVISIDPERMSGIPCFVGSRVPIQTLWDHLEDCDGMDTFLDDFEGVTREQALTVLRMAKEHLMAGLPVR